jgi:hypothetical protein
VNLPSFYRGDGLSNFPLKRPQISAILKVRVKHTEMFVSIFGTAANLSGRRRLCCAWLRQLVAGVTLRRAGFDAGLVHVRFMVEKCNWDSCSSSTSVSPVSIIPPMLHTHSFIYHRRCIMFFSQYFSFPCHYHSTNAPYSFIHLPPTLYNVFLPVLQFPLSVSFNQCSILNHASTTDAVSCFSPSTSVYYVFN